MEQQVKRNSISKKFGETQGNLSQHFSTRYRGRTAGLWLIYARPIEIMKYSVTVSTNVNSLQSVALRMMKKIF
jgi:hypothetical protein